MTYEVGGVDKDLATQFGKVPIDVIETSRQTTMALPDTNTGGNTMKLKFKAMYTYLFNSIDQRYKKHLILRVNTHR